MPGQFVRLAEAGRPAVHITVDGQPVPALAGDTVLTALLLAGRRLRENEFEHRPRAGFCLMGACQDCWIWHEDGTRIRSCSTAVADGMALLTQSPLAQWSIRRS